MKIWHIYSIDNIILPRALRRALIGAMMKSMKMLALAGLMAAANLASAAAGPAAPSMPDAAQVQAAHDLLAAMQAEKMMRTTAGMSRYPTPQQRQAVFDKLDKVPAEQIYQRLSIPVARLLSTETAKEMTHFYLSSYGQRVLKQTYNSGPSLFDSAPVPTAKEKAELKRPAYVKADQAFKEAQPAIHHETFVLLTAISR
jgi:malate synthase